MAWIPMQEGVDEKTLSVNRTNFPNLSVSYSNMHSVTSGENWIRGHTAGAGGYCYVQTGNFDCDGYESITINYSTDNWGTGVPGTAIYVNGVRAGYCSNQGSGSITYNLNGAEVANVLMRTPSTGSWDDGDNAWISDSLNSIVFTP